MISAYDSLLKKKKAHYLSRTGEVAVLHCFKRKILKFFFLETYWVREISFAKCPILSLLALLAGISRQLSPSVSYGTV